LFLKKVKMKEENECLLLNTPKFVGITVFEFSSPAS